MAGSQSIRACRRWYAHSHSKLVLRTGCEAQASVESILQTRTWAVTCHVARGVRGIRRAYWALTCRIHPPFHPSRSTDKSSFFKIFWCPFLFPPFPFFIYLSSGCRRSICTGKATTELPGYGWSSVILQTCRS